MPDLTRIKSALISVFSKENLEPVIRSLHAHNVSLFATGGTFDFIKQLHIPVIAVEDITEYPSILGGRVKTLHPKIFGGILFRRDNEQDKSETGQFKIPSIDLVIVDLYPFEKTVAELAAKNSLSFGEGWGEVIEKIDIGGISLLRAAAKNFNDVFVVPSCSDYDLLVDLLKNKNAVSSLAERKLQAAKTFAITSHYDTKIFNWFNRDAGLNYFKESEMVSQTLRYGENPHQKGFYFGNINDVFEKLNGKELSYNNLLDCDAAINLIAEFNDTTIGILKHNNACGIASHQNPIDAWKNALAGDPVSAFGGVIISNAEIDAATAAEINKLFFEIIIAPSYQKQALDILKEKKNRIILIQKQNKFSEKQFRNILNGVLVQDKDLNTETETNLTFATEKKPSPAEIADMLFANKIVKQSKSNAIVLAKNSQLLASGVGQTSRVDALKHAIEKACGFGFDLNGAVMASDAFFPFPDCVEIAGKAGITAIIQPGGSIKDKESVEYCNKNGLSMVLTGVRHFKH